jgi:lysyl-tRNA synthetase class 2
LYCEKARIKDAAFDQLKTSLDVGDFVGAKGTIKRTEKGELSVLVEELAILTKSLLPLPDKWHGLTDIEKRYRQR